jgi:hypothetical protein
MIPVQNRYAVITKDIFSFNNFMKTFTISMFSKARQKFWIHKGATEYMRITEKGQIPSSLSGVIMLDGGDIQLYLDACAAVGGPAVVTEAELAAEQKTADVINLINGEVSHDKETL